MALPFLDRERTIAGPGYSRWLVPPAALAVHLCIGQIYAFSVFKIPMTQLLGVGKSLPNEDWSMPAAGAPYSIGLAMLGLSAALFGRWVEESGPRKAMLMSALCFGSGFLIGAWGISLHQIWLVYLGYGVLGGIGLGLGYIAPVSTLIKWFPDRPGMATGMAIMGFGGGAMIGSPLAVALMDRFRTETSMGVAQTFVAMGLMYTAFMMFGVFTVRVPPRGWKPAGYVPPARPAKLVTSAHVEVSQAWKTPQFWLLWSVLCLNVTAGIGVIGQASPLIQEMFPGRITPAAAAGFVGLLSLFNLGGRFVWSSFSDHLGRKRTYMVYFTLGTVLYALLPTLAKTGNMILFVSACCVILSMYGGGFATIPAYLRDIFGTMHVSAIHGRLLTAWSVAAVLGPSLVDGIREYQIHRGVPKADAYTVTLYLMAGLLVVGFVSNLLITDVDEKHHFKAAGAEA